MSKTPHATTDTDIDPAEAIKFGTDEDATPRGRWHTVRTVVIVAIVALLIIVMALSSTTIQKSIADQVWDERATLGSLDASNYYIMYTDLACPYCDVFSRLTIENEEEFEQFLADNDILFELRLTSMLYESYESEISLNGAEATYCAMNEDKFWEYYHNAIQSLWDDYQSQGYGAYKGAPEITDIPEDYWLQIGYEVGLGDTFTECVNNRETADLVSANTTKAASSVSGLPYFIFNDFTTSGFDNSWEWDMVLQYLEAGL